MDNNLPNPEDLTDEELDALLETGTLPDKEAAPVKPDEPKPDDKPAEGNPEDEEDLSKKPDEGKDDKKPDEEAGKPDEPKPDEPKPDEPKPDEPAPKPDEPKPSRREQARVRDLLEKYGQPEKPAEKPQPKATGMDYENEIEASPEMIDKLKKDREAVAEASYNEGLEQMKSLQFLTRLEIDAPRVEAKYPQLDKNSKDFKPEASTDFNLLYLRFAGYDPETKKVTNPDFRYGDFADVIFQMANELADVKVEEQVKEVKKQAAQTGLRPDGSGAKKLDLTKAPEDMTDEELDAYLKQAIPQR